VTALVEQVAERRRQAVDPGVARAIRLNAGVSQAALAAELGVHRMTVNRWERGARRPSRTQLVAYRRLLDQLQDVS
jgi:DNA-binding transcriptional regulator YiaG